MAHKIIVKDRTHNSVAVRCSFVNQSSLRTTDQAGAVEKIEAKIAFLADRRFGVISLANLAFRVTAETLARNFIVEVAVGTLSVTGGAQFEQARNT